MAITQEFALGRNTRMTATIQTTPGTRPTPAATDSVMLQAPPRINVNEERMKRRNPQASQSLRELVQGNLDVDVSMVFEHLPRGAAVPPDIGDLLRSVFGSETIGGSSVTYALSNSQTLVPLWLEFDYGTAGANTAEMKDAIDCFVPESIKYTIEKGSIPLIEIAGPARNLVRTGRSTCAILSGGESTITLQTTAHSRFFHVNSVIGVGTSTGTAGAGHRVTAINHSTGVLTITPTISGAQSAGSAVYPISLFAEASTGGSPTPEIFVSCAFGAETGAAFLKAEIEIKRNLGKHRPVGTPLVGDFYPGFRDVDGTIEFEARRSDIQKLLRSEYVNVTGVNVEDLVFTYGQSGSAGSILTLNDCRFYWSALEMPASEVGRFSLPFTCSASSATAEDEVTHVFQTLP